MTQVSAGTTTDRTPERRATIVDVAARAGVSVASASKVLRNAYGVSDQMKVRVRAAMEELDYRPSASARGMRGRTYTVGMTVPDIDNQFVSLLIKGVADGLHESGFELLIGVAGNDEAMQSQMIDAMLDRQMDGLVLFAPYAKPERLASVARTTPTVVVSRHGAAPEYDTVVGDDVLGARLVVDHLVELGHERIAFVAHDDGVTTDPHSPHSVRERSYREAMHEHGVGAHIDVVRTAWSHVGGREAGAQLLDRASLPTAVFAGADVAALGLMSVLWERGVAIPEHVSVAGYDNISLSGFVPISMTSVDQFARDLGKEAARSVLERVEGRVESHHTVLPPQLEARGSTAAARRH